LSLYRQPGRTRATTLVAVGAIALLVGGGLGFALARATEDDPTVSAALVPVTAKLRTVSNGLELVPTEYPQALRGSGDEIEGVNADLKRVRAALGSVRGDLERLDPAGLQAVEADLDALEAAVRGKVAADRVSELAERATTDVERLPG
jgi:hypothetical protein